MEGFFHHINITPVKERLTSAGIGDTMKWAQRLMDLKTKETMRQSFPQLLDGDLFEIEDALSAAAGHEFAFANSTSLVEKTAGAAETEGPCVSLAIAVPGHGPQTKNYRLFQAQHLGSGEKGFRVNNHDGKLKLGRQASCFYGAVSEAGCKAKAAWYAKVCKVTSQEFAPSLEEPYYPGQNDVKDILIFLDTILPDLMKEVSQKDREATLRRQFGKLTKIDGKGDL